MNLALGLTEGPSTVAVVRPDVDELFVEHVDFVWRALRHFGVREADLEDQTQEVFLVAYRRYSAWDGEHPRAWLYAIARRRASMYRRRGHRRHELPVAEIPESGAQTNALSNFDAERLQHALAMLDEDRRAVFVLFEIGEMSMRAVAAALGCPIQTAYSRLYSARRELARLLEDR